MSKVLARRESGSWWMVACSALYGGLTGILNIVGNPDPDFWAVRFVPFIIGALVGVVVYLAFRLGTKMSKNQSALMALAIRTGFVQVFCVVLLQGQLNVGYLVGSFLGGMVLGGLFYLIERGVAKMFEPKLAEEPKPKAVPPNSES